MKSNRGSARKSEVFLLISVLCVLMIAGISSLNLSYGTMSGSAPNQVIKAQNNFHNGAVWSTTSQTGSPALGCVEPLTSTIVNAYYSEPYCYGHDEAILGFLSSEPGSGGNALLNFTLPASTVIPQGALYIAFWIGGVVYDQSSLNNQAFMELQFFPSSPQFTGSGSGAKDCSSQGFNFNANGLNSNEWFACVFLFAVNQTSFAEYIPFAAPLDLQGSADQIMTMSRNDLVSVKLNGSAKSVTQPWQISLFDYASGKLSSLVSLENGSSIFPPFYGTSSILNALSWGAEESPPIDFAFELGHTLASFSLSPNDCTGINFTDGGTGGIPGDNMCESYSPGLWLQAGPIHVSMPLMGTTPAQPSQISFSSSQGGVSEVYKSSQPKSKCTIPSFSTSTNCIYPFYAFEYNTSSFIFLSSLASGNMNNYGNSYEFPGTQDPNTGQFVSNVQPAPTLPTAVTTTLTHTATSVTTATSVSTSYATSFSAATSTVTLKPAPQNYSLTIETRSPGGSALAGQIVTISNSSGFSRRATTDSSGTIVLTDLSPGSSYTASSNINGSTLSASVALNGNSVILLEPTALNTSSTTSSTRSISPPPIPAAYLIFLIFGIGVATITSVIYVRRRSSSA